jgi:hypothetical protein
MTDPAQYESWLDSGFAWLGDNWTEQDWTEARAGFVAALGLANAEDEPVVHALVSEIDAMAPEERRETVLDAGARASLVRRALGAAGPAGVEPGAAGPAGDTPVAATDVEPVYVEGTGWMRWDAAAQTWAPTEGDAAAAPASDGAAGPAAGGSAAPGADDAAAPGAGDAAAPALEPAEVASHVTEQVALPALTDALAAMPQLAEIPADELNRLLSEVLAERLAAASG